MTRPRNKPLPQYHAMLVEPDEKFSPTNWQDKPKQYQIVEYLGPIPFRGRVDAWRFLHNHKALTTGDTRTWAIYVN